MKQNNMNSNNSSNINNNSNSNNYNTSSSSSSYTSNSTSKQKRIAALIGIALLAALYLVTLCLAIFGNENTTSWFMGCICATIIVPILIWVYLWFYKMLKKDVADAAEKAYRQQTAEDGQDDQTNNSAGTN